MRYRIAEQQPASRMIPYLRTELKRYTRMAPKQLEVPEFDPYLARVDALPGPGEVDLGRTWPYGPGREYDRLFPEGVIETLCGPQPIWDKVCVRVGGWVWGGRVRLFLSLVLLCNTHIAVVVIAPAVDPPALHTSPVRRSPPHRPRPPGGRHADRRVRPIRAQAPPRGPPNGDSAPLSLCGG